MVNLGKILAPNITRESHLIADSSLVTQPLAFRASDYACQPSIRGDASADSGTRDAISMAGVALL